MEQEHEDVVASSKHVCKVCSRRFGCGRALGGHMRIHGSASASQFNAAQDEDYVVINRRRGSETQSRNNNTLVPASGKQEEGEGEEEAEEEEEEASCGGDRVNDLSKNSNPMYDLRPNRKRSWRYADVDYSFLVPASASASASADFGSKFGASTSFQICEECGEEFPSWKTLIRHMRCHYRNKAEEGEQEEEEEESNSGDDDDGKEREQNEFSDSESDTETVRLRGPHSPEINPERIIKGKRSKRPRQRRPSSEEAVPVAFAPGSEVEYMADCLVMLASSGESWEPGKHSFDRDVECSTSGAKRDFTHGPAPVIRKRKRRTSPSNSATGNVHAQSASGKLPLPLPPKKTRYECKTCKKIFQSFQALGGHRASHNKFKGCSAKQEEEENEENENDNLEEEIITSDEDLSKDLAKSAPPKKKKPRDSCDKEKESIADNKGNVCSKTFESGQVLGEYWLASSTISSTKESPSPWLDLNLPAPDDESPPNKRLHSNQKQGLYSISTLVDGDDESSDRDGLVTGEDVASRNIAALPQSCLQA